MEERTEEKVYCLWVDWDNRVISFQKAEGFQCMQYPSHEQMFAFAVKKGFDGFGIQ